jgi:hypothetical protein
MNKKTLSGDDQIKLILGIALLLGAIVRFFPGIQAGFPLNDGGMFLSMIRDLHASHYTLPVTTSYNQLALPYAYPPFGFYFIRLLSDLFKVSELAWLRWVPPAVSTLSIFAFYELASAILESKWRGVLAASFYALTPASFNWLVMGGGLTRGFGILFALLSIWSVYRLFCEYSRSVLVLSILFCTLTVLSHPEAGIQTAAVCVLIWLFYGRTAPTAIHAFIAAVGTLLFSAPWWLTVLAYHGLAPFLSAIHTGIYRASLLSYIYSAILSREAFLPVLVLLRSAGIIWALWKRKYMLVLWVVLPFVVDPRFAPTIVFFAMCMLMALVIADGLPAIAGFLRRSKPMELIQNQWFNAGLILLLLYLFVESLLYGFGLVNTSLSHGDLDVMNWSQHNTPVKSRFFLLTGIRSQEVDPFNEWFPALAERRSQSTLQGYEWLLGSKFFGRYRDLAELQSCQTVVCVNDWSARMGLDYRYVILRKKGVGKVLLNSFADSPEYKVVYETSGSIVYLLSQP